MNDDDVMFREYASNSEALSRDLDQIAQEIRTIAKNSRGDGIALLALLRVLEALHREIREGFFQESLPSNRQALYALLKDIEASGGWPYIHRMRLQEFLNNLLAESSLDSPE
ncbi:hypothetical protein NIES2135_18690 [Leptolyngbya boryana NIES-2135]|jgi:hypothetical protein|uniref:Uncharacterized protein n=3 Tax=Leptolyngbya TaxID=47251 RepID=A0A1Z4JEF6_LEPBY|nr:hypothetical protein LBWT_45900 [Leptolyngbya boryana IAM M-101]BAS64971.1 hypothetical protein LBDG_45900 [Leptolyngbya boryana dg5]BAY55048.1 hypothetical protein NIES2135_18690 [Leptolyngbya boryana NIES-2135]